MADLNTDPGAQVLDPAAAQNIADTTNAQTGGADGGEQNQVTPKTYTEQEHRDAIERATAKAAAKAERRAFREATDRLSQQQPNQPQGRQADADDGRPQRAQFKSDEAWLDARDAWRDSQRDAADAGRKQQEQARTIAKKTDGIYAEAEKLPGFDREEFNELLSEHSPARECIAAIVDSDMAAKLMLHLQQNPADFERITKLPASRQAAEIGKLEDKVAQAKPPARSNAPTALGGAKGSTTVSMPNPADTKAYIKWANAQERSG